MDRTTELRKLPPAAIFKLGQMLDIDNTWQQVMALIPKDTFDLNSEPKYSLEHIKLIEGASEKQNRSYTEILLDEWGTSGKVRPTINTLLEVLLKAQFYRAADFVAVELLHDKPPPRPLEGPAALVDFDINKTSCSEISKSPESGELCSVKHVPFSVLQDVTDNFDDSPLVYFVRNGICRRTGHKLGTGAFGTVYFGEMSNGRKVAVKKLSVATAALEKQFENEILTLSEYQQENLVPLLGFSCDTDVYCLVYEFMANGSLLDKLQLKHFYVYGGDTNVVLNGMASNTFNSAGKPLHWKKRLDIAIDISRGIRFLHTYKETPLIHRDVKTANVLLDEQLRAKLGDFGLVKVKSNLSESKLLTTTVFGTSAYMAPEAFRGDVSVKIDVFSFGVILLELLTGLAPYDENREGCDLVTYIEDVVDDSIVLLLDEKAGKWNESTAQNIFELAQSCLLEKRKRPVIQDVLQSLENIQSLL